jgi:error-prone DNA polymerase
MPSYVELRARSAFSFGDGVLTPEALVARAAELGYGALGLTDAADLGGAVRFAMAARERGVRPVLGAELRVEGGRWRCWPATRRGTATSPRW